MEEIFGNLRKQDTNLGIKFFRNGVEDQLKVIGGGGHTKKSNQQKSLSTLSLKFEELISAETVIEYKKDASTYLCVVFQDDVEICDREDGELKLWRIGQEKHGETSTLVVKNQGMVHHISIHDTINAALYKGCFPKKNVRINILTKNVSFDTCRDMCHDEGYESFLLLKNECACAEEKQNRRINGSFIQSDSCNCVEQQVDSSSLCLYHNQRTNKVSKFAGKVSQKKRHVGDSLKERDDVAEESDHFNKAPKVIGIEDVHERKPQKVSPLKRSNQQVSNFNNIITNVCHPESGDAQDLRRSVGARTGARPASRGGRGGSNNRSRVGSDICEHASTLLTTASIIAAPLAFCPNPAFGVAAAAAIGASTLVTSMACPSDEGPDYTKLKEEILSIMDRTIATEIQLNEIDQLTGDIEHIALQMDDEIFPFSYVTAESYSRELSLLQNQAARNFNWYYIPVFVQIASAHLTMKNYLVPHSLKISPECGWRRLESYYAAKAIALEDFNALIDTYATVEQEWIETETVGPTEYCESHSCSNRGNYDDGGQCNRNFHYQNRHPNYCRYKYQWRDHNHNYQGGFATSALAREHQIDYFASVISNQDEVLSSEIIDFRNELLRDDAEDLESCGVIGEISKVCSCLTGRPYCNMAQQLCVEETQSEANDYNCPITDGRFAEPTHNWGSGTDLGFGLTWNMGQQMASAHVFFDSRYTMVPFNTETYLGVIDEPGENYEINFIFRGHNYRAIHKALFRFTNREGYTNYSTHGDRSPLITWYDGKPLVYVKEQQRSIGFGKDLDRIDLNQDISIKVVFLVNRILIYRGDGGWLTYNSNKSDRPLLDRLHVFFGDRFYQNIDVVQVRSLIFRKIMYGNKLIDDNRYRSLDYKIGDFPSLSTVHVKHDSHTSVFDRLIGAIASIDFRYQVSFTIVRTDDTIYTDQEASILRFKCSTFTGGNNYFPYVFSWDGKVSYGIRHESGTLWGHTHQLPIGEKTHVKIVDVRGDEIVIYVNGIRYSEDMTDIARHTCSGALLVETGNNGVPTSFEIYNLFYQSLQG